MSTLVAEVRAQSLDVTNDSLIVDLTDGRSITESEERNDEQAKS